MNAKRKSIWIVYPSVLFLTAAVTAIAMVHSLRAPPTVRGMVETSGIEKPSDILRFKGKFVCTELKNNRLAIFDDFQFQQLDYFDPKAIGRRFSSPHFMAVSPFNTLLISNGWGNSVVEIADLDGRGWKVFKGAGERHFRAPHGIAVDRDEGWIYVGDSLNSRIVRFKNMQGDHWEVFKDHEKKIAYSRQLVFKFGALWVSNSYEKIRGLNPGVGANVLQIDDFSSGLVKEVYRTERSNLTGICPLRDHLIIAVWRGGNHLVAKELKDGQSAIIEGSHNRLKTPYGIYEDTSDGKLVAAYFGDFKDKNGGFLILDR
jgi:hypothetical protein